MTEYDNTGKATMWKVRSENPKAPYCRIECYAHRDIKMGEKFEIPLWKNDSENPKAPPMKGNVTDAFQPKQQESAPPPADEFDDDIPF